MLKKFTKKSSEFSMNEEIAWKQKELFHWIRRQYIHRKEKESKYPLNFQLVQFAKIIGNERIDLIVKFSIVTSFRWFHRFDIFNNRWDFNYYRNLVAFARNWTGEINPFWLRNLHDLLILEFNICKDFGN
jgi:hypothetical protein